MVGDDKTKKDVGDRGSGDVRERNQDDQFGETVYDAEDIGAAVR